MSADGTKLVFISRSDALVTGDTNETYDVFVKDLTSGDIVRASTASDGTGANGIAEHAVISSDGTMVAFSDDADNLVDADGFGINVFLKNLVTDETTCLSLGVGGDLGNGDSDDPQFSSDGRFVAFVSDADDLVPETQTAI